MALTLHYVVDDIDTPETTVLTDRTGQYDAHSREAVPLDEEKIPGHKTVHMLSLVNIELREGQIHENRGVTCFKTPFIENIVGNPALTVMTAAWYPVQPRGHCHLWQLGDINPPGRKGLAVEVLHHLLKVIAGHNVDIIYNPINSFGRYMLYRPIVMTVVNTPKPTMGESIDVFINSQITGAGIAKDLVKQPINGAEALPLDLDAGPFVLGGENPASLGCNAYLAEVKLWTESLPAETRVAEEQIMMQTYGATQ